MALRMMSTQTLSCIAKSRRCDVVSFINGSVFVVGFRVLGASKGAYVDRPLEASEVVFSCFFFHSEGKCVGLAYGGGGDGSRHS